MTDLRELTLEERGDVMEVVRLLPLRCMGTDPTEIRGRKFHLRIRSTAVTVAWSWPRVRLERKVWCLHGKDFPMKEVT
jgi:hypothetical protein